MTGRNWAKWLTQTSKTSSFLKLAFYSSGATVTHLPMMADN